MKNPPTAQELTALRATLDKKNWGPALSDKAWKEFERRYPNTPVSPSNVLYDLIWEIEAGKWPKKRKN